MWPMFESSDKSINLYYMMTLLNVNIFRITGPLWVESTGHQFPDSPHKGQWRGCFLWSMPEQTVKQTTKKSVIWDAIALIMTSL